MACWRPRLLICDDSLQNRLQLVASSAEIGKHHCKVRKIHILIAVQIAIVAPGAGFAVAPIAGAAAGVDYDYDCDGVEEREYPLARDASSDCSGAGVLGCTGDVYWAGPTAPACGTSATLSFCRSGLLSCSRGTSTATVACR